ncbi:hypothetical protein OL229_05790 [Neisseriaceae bacterium JH1-16]|nr:hypothetical protein [Neisseriaceae bacterium JH1-16]
MADTDGLAQITPQCCHDTGQNHAWEEMDAPQHLQKQGFRQKIDPHHRPYEIRQEAGQSLDAPLQQATRAEAPQQIGKTGIYAHASF